MSIDKKFAERINPRQHKFSPKLVAIVGGILGYDYGVRDRKGGHLGCPVITSDGFVTASSTASDGGGAFIGNAGDMEQNLSLWKSELSPEDREEFNKIYRERVIDYRSKR